MSGQQLILWTIRISLVCYVAAITLQFTVHSRQADKLPRPRRWIRGIWTTACAFFLLHLVAAFHFHHHWSNEHAVQDTARQTEQLIGLAFGRGIYFSYVFALLWLADVVWWWAAPTRYEQRHLATGLAIHGYLFFIAFNGAIVFESGVTRWLGIPACLVLVGLGIWRIASPPQTAACE